MAIGDPVVGDMATIYCDNINDVLKAILDLLQKWDREQSGDSKVSDPYCIKCESCSGELWRTYPRINTEDESIGDHWVCSKCGQWR